MTDPTFDRALRAAARRGRPAGDHPDAAMLASYVDRSLSTAEREALEAHVADCRECMEHLAMLASVNVPADLPGLFEGWSIRRLLSGWGWLVPVATAVLVVVIWRNQPAPPSVLPGGAPVASPTPAPASRQSEAEGRQKDGASLDAATPSDPLRRADAGAAKNRPSPAARELRDERLQAATPKFGDTSLAAKKEQSLRERDKKSLDAQSEYKPAAENKVAAQGETARQAPPVAAAAPPPAAPNVAPPAGAGARADAAMPRRQAEAIAARPNEQAAGAFLKSSMTAPVVLVHTPGVSIRRIGDRLERSIDDGRTWTVDLTSAPASLRAGACPGPAVCWLGGTSGVVLVRDASGAWTRRDLADATAVIAAIDAQGSDTATITLTDGRQFQTTDRGLTWTLRSSPPPSP